MNNSFTKFLNHIKSFTVKLNFYSIGFTVVFIVIFLKLINVQILNSDKYRIAAKKQYENKIVLNPSRGLVYDRNMNVLVSNSLQLSFAADPNMIESADSIATEFAKVFHKDKSEYLSKLTNKNVSFIYLERKVDINVAGGLDSINVPGMIVLKEPKRVYNYGTLASQVLGFTSQDEKGLMGLEMSMDNELAGKEGYIVMQRDGKGQNKPSIEYPKKDPVNGNSIQLTLDINIQKIAEEELTSAIQRYKADHGKVVVMSVKSGEILGMCSYPTFDPNNIRQEDTIGFKNRVITDMYEPGSTFKLVSASACLEEKLYDKSSIINTENGEYNIYGLTIKDEHKSSSMTFQQVIEMSSNVGVAKLSMRLGSERFYKYARDFGFGISTGIELPGENKGMLKRPIDYTVTSLPYMGTGYEVNINALQIATAYNCIANHGMLLKPYIVRKESTSDGTIIFENHPQNVRQVVSENTSKIMTMLFTGVVERGTGTDAKIEGINVAGKTGTAQMYKNNEYTSNAHTASFVGYFPAENPQILIAVILDDPKSGEFYGGKVSAPVFKTIAERIINFSGNLDFSQPQLKNIEQKSNDIKFVNNDYSLMPNLVNMKYEDAVEILKEMRLNFDILESPKPSGKKDGRSMEVIESQYPEANSKIVISDNLKVKLVKVKRKIDGNSLQMVPDVSSLSLRKAINILTTSGFNIEVNGFGEVVSQYPIAGSSMLPFSKVTIFCKQVN
ncbi:penicillin-binding transpeptidase domain-containing protein [soil metagenome]